MRRSPRSYLNKGSKIAFAIFLEHTAVSKQKLFQSAEILISVLRATLILLKCVDLKEIYLAL